MSDENLRFISTLFLVAMGTGIFMAFAGLMFLCFAMP